MSAYDTDPDGRPYDTAAPEGPGSSNAAGLGIAAIAASMIVSQFGPGLVRGRARQAIKWAAKGGSRAAGEGAVSAFARRAVRGAVRATGKEREAATFVKRARVAVHQAGKGDIDVSRFARRTGVSTPYNLREKGATYERFKTDRHVKRAGGVLPSLLRDSRARDQLLKRHGGARKLATSAAASWARGMMIEAPLVYGVDQMTGIITGPDKERAAITDPVGQLKQIATWLPAYAANDIAGRALMGAPGALMGLIRKGTSGALAGNTKVAQAVSTAYGHASEAHRRMQDKSSVFRTAYDRQMKRGTVDPATAALRAAAMLQRNQARAKAVLAKSGPAAARPKGSPVDLTSDRALMGVRNLLAQRKELVEGLVGLDHDNVGTAVDALFGDFRKPHKGAAVKGVMGRIFKGRTMTVGEVEDTFADRMTAATRKQLDELKGDVQLLNNQVRSTLKKGDPARKRIGTINYRDLRVDSVMRVGEGPMAQAVRMPTGADLAYMGGRFAERATTIAGRISVFGVLHGRTLTDPTPTARRVSGPRSVGGVKRYFGEHTAELEGQYKDQIYTHAFEFAAGGRKTKIFGRRHGGDTFEELTEAGGETVLDAQSKLGQMAARLQNLGQGADMSPEAQIREARENALSDLIGRKTGRTGILSNAFLRKKLGIMDGSSDTAVHAARDLFGDRTVRRLFGRGKTGRGGFFGVDAATATPEGLIPLAAGLDAAKAASRNGAGVFLQPELFREATHTLRTSRVFDGLDVDDVLHDDRSALAVAERILGRSVTSADSRLQSGTEAAARHIVEQSKSVHPDTLFNLQGKRNAETLRQFIFEHGALERASQEGLEADGSAVFTRKLMGMVDDMAGRGELAKRQAAEAKAGLAYLDVKATTPLLPHNPFGELVDDATAAARGRTRTPGQDNPWVASQQAFRRHEGTLNEFAQSRPLVDTQYHRRALTDLADNIDHDAYVSVQGGVGGMARLVQEAGFDTTRKALGLIGMGWNPSKFTTTGQDIAGQKTTSIATLFRNRALAAGAVFTAYALADTALDVGLPDGAPLSEGLTVGLGSTLAGVRRASARVQDTLGVTDAAQWAEGLMPKSTSMIPGMIAGYALGGRTLKGAVVGGVLNRISMETLKDTPFEALSAIPGLAPFVSDMTETSEEVDAKYAGEQWVSVRKGRGFLLSTSDFAGGRIEQWRPNWYTLLKGQPKATPALYGSKVEQALFRDLPLLDMSIGDIVDPDYLTQKHYDDRPYVAQDYIGSEFPVIGALIGRSFGKAYNAVHPAAGGGAMHMEGLVGADGPGSAAASMLGGVSAGSIQTGDLATGFSVLDGPDTARQGYAAYRTSGTVVSEDSARAAYDETFYRMSEAMGFTGFIAQQAVGGEGLFRDAVMPSASRMGSTGSAYHDLAMGDFLGVGEAVRRLLPFERDFTSVGPENTMPGWLPDELRRGDPYCVLPGTGVELDGHLVPAETVYEEVQARYADSARPALARTHRGRYRPFLGAARRWVSEPCVRLRVAGLPWAIELTRQHPVLVGRRRIMPGGKTDWSFVWALAGELQPGDHVLAPAVAPDGVAPGVPLPRWYDEREASDDRSPGDERPCDWATALPALASAKPEPPGTRALLVTALSERERQAVEAGFGLQGSARTRRRAPLAAATRTEMAEHGLPVAAAALPAAGVRCLLEAMTASGLPLADALGLNPRLDWASRSPTYLPAGAAAVSDALYTLWRAMLAAGVNPGLEDGRLRARVPGVNPVQVESSEGKYRHGALEVLEAEHFDYDGYVYAFEVDEDETFVVGGIATHNSKVMMGEAVLPGAGYESIGGGRTGQRTLDAAEIGGDVYETAMNMLGVGADGRGYSARDASGPKSWAKEAATNLLLDSGQAVRQQAVVVDEASGMVGVADAMSKGGNVVQVKSLSGEAFRSMGRGMAEGDRERLNALVGASKKSSGMQVYVSEETGEIQTFVQTYDERLYGRTTRKLQQARELAYSYAEDGYGTPGAMYSTGDRMRVLLNADPFSEEFRMERRKAKALQGAGLMDQRESGLVDRVNSMQEEMAMPFEVYPNRFRGKVLSPEVTVAQTTFNDNIKAAASYSMGERMIGSAWESFANVRSPLHTRFFGSPDIETKYTSEVLLSRSFQSWNDPVEDFVMPYARGLRAADSAVQGAVSFGTGAALLGGGPWSVIGAAAGAVYGTAHGAYRKITGTRYVPGDTEELRETEQAFDRLKYHRAGTLFQATGSKQFADEMGHTAYGWVQAGMAERGWAKERRHEMNPQTQHTGGGLFGGDLGFGSPWRGIMKAINAIRGVTSEARATVAATESAFGSAVVTTGRMRAAERTMSRSARRSATSAYKAGASLQPAGQQSRLEALSVVRARVAARDGAATGAQFGPSTFREQSVFTEAMDRVTARGGTLRPRPGVHRSPTTGPGTVARVRTSPYQGLTSERRSLSRADGAGKRAQSHVPMRAIKRLKGAERAAAMEMKHMQMGQAVSRLRMGKATSTLEMGFTNNETSMALGKARHMSSSGASRAGQPQTRLEALTSLRQQRQAKNAHFMDVVRAQETTPFSTTETEVMREVRTRLASRGAAPRQPYTPSEERLANDRFWKQKGVEDRNRWAREGNYNTRQHVFPQPVQAPLTPEVKHSYARSGGYNDRPHLYPQPKAAPLTPEVKHSYARSGGYNDRPHLYPQPKSTYVESPASRHSAARAGRYNGPAQLYPQPAAGPTPSSTAYGPSRPQAHLHPQPAPVGSGFSETGMAKELRAKNTRVEGNLGFGSPWQGVDHQAQLGFSAAEDPYAARRQIFPPEVYTAFSAAPRSERKFLRAMLGEADASRRADIAKMVSPDMAAVLETGWSYLDGDGAPGEPGDGPGYAETMDAMPGLALGAMNPAMGLGADLEGYQVRTMQDLGQDTHEAGIGWKSSLTRINNLLVEPQSLAKDIGATSMLGSGASEATTVSVRAALIVALRQMGILANITVEQCQGPSEITFRQS